ncbi:unnamed protein product [Cuscuta campestris]|uniref:CASP-like protein n=1 Tax=Cuscuta campestris TaxID=132261 RepID=A0A484MVJ6_9ASTE|nr:unnamed protein product [Cuscuta campestris]
MDGIAALLGYQAELAQDKVKHVKVLFIECEKGGSKEALVLGYAALICFAVAHLATHTAGDLYVCCRSMIMSCFSQMALCVLLAVWVLWGAGACLLYIGAKGNQRHGTKCGVSHHGFLKWGAYICCAHLIISLLYCILSHNLFMKAAITSTAPKVVTRV